MMIGMGGGMIAMMVASVVFYLALLVLVVLCIAWLVRSLRQPVTGAGSDGAQPSTPLRKAER